MKKLLSLRKLLKISKNLKRGKKKIVFTNGVYDILTVAHVRYLQKARKQGDILIVGLNSDASTRKLKGKERPIVPANRRAEILAQLSYVDYIYIFSNITPLKVLEAVKPDVYVKGGDYKKKRTDKSGCREYVRNYGGKVFLTPLIRGISTTKIIKRILNLYEKKIKHE